ncbi:MAG: hypothetical protein JST26_03335 [Bacteroidetes bacterium]|nr:hypothetical protein [Bacteroidota bacterium]
MSIIKNIYKAISGKDYGPLWEKFAQERQGVYVPEGGDKVQVFHNGFSVVIDAYTHYTTVGGVTREEEYTRVCTEFENPGGFWFSLAPQGIFETIGKMFGAQDIVVGDETFDKRFMIKGNDEALVQLLFADENFRKACMQQKVQRLELTEKEGLFGEKPAPEKAMLYFLIEKEVTQLEELHEIYDFYSNLIDRLIRLRVMRVTVKNPGV